MNFSQWLGQLDFGWFAETAVILLSSLLCICIHETCHGLAAYALGDPTAKRSHRLSLNPLRHIDLFGLLAMAIFHFGWAKPVPVDPRYFRHPKGGMALTALAGPVSNMLLSFFAILGWYGYLLAGGGAEGYTALFLQYTALLSAGLAVFNLFPIPPLDGSKVLFALLPDRAYALLLRWERYGMILLLALLYFGVLDAPLEALRSLLLDGLQAAALGIFELFI